MKTTFKFFAAALAIVAAASCSKEPNSPIDNSNVDEPQKVHMVFSASLENDNNPDSKTTLASDGLSVHWAAGDEIMLIPYNGSTFQSGSKFAVVESSINGTFADFEGDAVNVDAYRAVYPAAAYDETNHPTNVNRYCFVSNTLATQYAVEGDFSQTSFGCSNIAVSSTSQDNHLYFKNINAFLKFQVAEDGVYKVEVSASAATGSSTGTLEEGYNLGSILNYNPSTGAVWMSMARTAITFQQKDGSALKTGVDYYIAIPAVEMTNFSVSLQNASGETLHTYTKPSFKANSNKIYKLGDLKIPAKVGDYYYTDGTYSTAYDSSKTLAGIVFYVGDGMTADETLMKDYPSCTHGLVVAMNAKNFSDPLSNTNVKKWDDSVIGLQGTFGELSRTDASYVMTGYHNTQSVKAKYSTCSAISKLSSEEDYPVVSMNATPWFIPSFAEYDQLYKNITLVNTSISAVPGKSQITSNNYWTSTFGYDTLYEKLYYGVYNVAEGKTGKSTYSDTRYFLPIFAF